MSGLKFTPPYIQKSGTISAILKICYADLVSSDPDLWGNEAEAWKRFDDDVYKETETTGDCTFLSWLENNLIGFASYDPRQWPAYGIIGHNCILPQFQRRGFGKLQILEILKRFQKMEFKKAKVSTLDHPFFVPAQEIYLVCGFSELGRYPWEGSPDYRLIEYEKSLR